MKPSGVGFDAPTRNDALGRQPFAADIARIATKSPAEWSVRIGVYGGWGTGKTSVLLMVQEKVEAQGHRAVWFNPWGYDNIDAMWAAFVEGVFGALAEWGIEAPGSKGAALKARSAKLVQFARGLMPMATPVLTAAKVSEPTTAVISTAAEAAVSTAMPFLDRWLRVGRDDLKGVVEALEGKRVVVLMDDVDRADPGLLPRMFHAVKELLDLPGFSFVLALDPEVVGPALRRHHEGFGIEFLEKVIDFPKWLPEPRRDDLWQVAVADLQRYCPFLDEEVVRRSFHLLPSNPRRLRMFIRQLWSLEAQVERHDDEELDRAALVLIHLLKVLWPKLASAALASEDFLEQLAVMKFFGKRDAQGEMSDLITDMCRKVLGDESPDVSQASTVLKVVGESWRLLKADQIRYLADLTERPHAVTWKEFHNLLAQWDGTAKVLHARVDQHAKAHGNPPMRVRSELAFAATEFIGHCCDRAASDGDEAAIVDWMAKAGKALKLLDLLWNHGDEQRTAEVFGRALSTFVRWMHFENHDEYRKQRGRERDLLVRMVATAPPDAAPRFYDRVSGQAVLDEIPFHRSEAAALFAKLRKPLAPAVARRCAALFRSPQAVRQTARSRDALAEQVVLFDGTGPLWSGQRAETLILVGEAGGNAVVHQNVVDFLHLVTDESALAGGIGPASADGIRSLIGDSEIVAALWKAACSRTANPRHLRSLSEIRQRLEESTGGDLEEPEWWSRVAAEVGIHDMEQARDDATPHADDAAPDLGGAGDDDEVENSEE